VKEMEELEVGMVETVELEVEMAETGEEEEMEVRVLEKRAKSAQTHCRVASGL